MKNIIPFGNRLLVKRKKVGEKVGKESMIYVPDTVKERDTDLAEVVYVPELSMADKELLHSADEIIHGLAIESTKGNPQAFDALFKFKDFLNKKSIKVGDNVMISKYVGITFHDNKGGDELTLVDADDLIGMVVDK